MMDAVIYGMIPRAKTVTPDMFPPENRFAIPQTLSWC